MHTETKIRNSEVPLVTILLAATVLLLHAVSASSLYYNRELVLQGEMWRLLSGHLMHYGYEHLLSNTIIFAAAGMMLEKRSRKDFISLLLVTAFATSLVFILLLPDMAEYAGMSAITTALVAYLGLVGMRHQRQQKWIWIAILCMLVAKIGLEVYQGHGLFISFADANTVVVPAAHVTGVVMALGWGLKNRVLFAPVPTGQTEQGA